MSRLITLADRVIPAQAISEHLEARPHPLGNPDGPGARPRWNRLAWVSLVLGAVTLWGLGSLAAIPTGLVALHQITSASDREPQRGKVVAILGVILGAIGTATLSLMVLQLTS
ncbi:MAG: DUF4190 domain-containing protein [Cellulomonadaceae bacterium]|jgi:hypothetical protein|nr:DUF4190 domain-containing protein [Cellulomonadaceae bacterium]